MPDNPANGKGVALFGLLSIPYIKYFLMHPTGRVSGIFRNVRNGKDSGICKNENIKYLLSLCLTVDTAIRTLGFI